MPVQCEQTIDVSVGASQAFALLDDLPRTPEWLGPCVALEKLAPGPNTLGDKLKYTYQQGGRKGVMQGEIVAREPDRKLTCRYHDTMASIKSLLESRPG